MRKMVKRWFGPYIVLRVFDNATYKLSELDGAELRVLIAGKRIKLFKKRDAELMMENIAPETEANGIDEQEEEEEVQEDEPDQEI